MPEQKLIKLERLVLDALETYILEELADGEWFDDNMEEVIEQYWNEAIEHFKLVTKDY